MNVNIIIINMMHYIRSVEYTHKSSHQRSAFTYRNSQYMMTTNESLKMINPEESPK